MEEPADPNAVAAPKAAVSAPQPKTVAPTIKPEKPGTEPANAKELAPEAAAGVEALNVTSSPAVHIALTDANGDAVKEIGLEKDIKGFYDFFFKTKIDKPHQDYTSWAFEARDPQEGRYYQMAFEGKLPEIVHWDGIFSDETEVKLRKKYFFRLVLVKPGGNLVGSPWISFATGKKKPYEGPKNRGEYITLYVMPRGGAHLIYLKTNSLSKILYPSAYGDFRIHLLDSYMCGMGFTTTANTVFGYNASAEGFGYSDISGFCRYRLVGRPLRAPILPQSPSYMGKDFKANIPEDVWGAPNNLEVGARLFYSTLRGFAGSALDAQLFRSITGLAATLNYDRALWLFRAHLGLEGGYSVFQGSILTGTVDFGLTYDRLRDIAPGIQIRYSLFKGRPAADQFNANTEVTDHMVFLGLMGYFKL